MLTVAMLSDSATLEAAPPQNIDTDQLISEGRQRVMFT